VPRAVVFALLVCCAVGRADILSLKDGRFVDGRKIEKAGGGFFVHFDNGKVFVPEGLVADYYQEAQGEFVPRSEEEKEKSEQGFVPWRGRWVRKSYRERTLQKEKERRLRIVQQQKERQLWRNHATVKTKNFVYKHTLPDEIFNELKELFEAYYAYFTKFWKVRPSYGYGKATIHIYHDDEYYYQRSGAPRGAVGYYNLLDRELHFYYDRRRHRFTVDVMFHEGNHMLVHMIDEKIFYPWWISEGMAEYFGASRWDPVKKEMSTGHLQSARLAVLQYEIENDRWLELSKLLNANRMGATEYAWTWSFCHFLMQSDRYGKGFKKYFIALGKSASVSRKPIGLVYKGIEPDEAIATLKKYIKFKSIEALQEEWYTYIKENLTRRMKDLDYGQAGWIMKLYGQSDKARKLFWKAIKNGSRRAADHYGYAELRYLKKPELALKHAGLATRFDPLFARAWALQGLLTVDDDPEEGMRLLALAGEIDPDDNQIWLWTEDAKEKLDDG
jgi:hypothetical protein